MSVFKRTMHLRPYGSFSTVIDKKDELKLAVLKSSRAHASRTHILFCISLQADSKSCF
ncbi:hypothetical protein EVA_03745 [gut metagenome]|uniref:Uncharacterized protein n=1 Tax=gut metagenome TaxID=749906 RepID=J9D605_9ZZZZ